MRVLAIDQGTSSTRGFLYDGKANNVICTREHRQLYPQPDWVEHDPEELLQHIVECIVAAGPVDAIGLDNQGESCLAWDAKTGKAISPVIVWQDRRTEKYINKLKADGAQSLTLAKAGLPLDPYFSASKLAWILENVSDAKTLLGNGRLRLGTTDAFFIHRLTGVYATDITTASRTSLLNLETGEWDQALCDLFGVPISALPEIKPTTGEFGIIDIGGRKIPLLASIVDQQASLFGHGCRQSGDAKITFGTGAFALALTGASAMRAPDKGLLPTIAWQCEHERPVYALEGGVYCAGSALNWARSLGLFSDFSEINNFAANAAVTRGLVFVPALTGLGSPHWDGSAAGLWIGMSLDTTANDLVQAILEGIALRTGQVIQAMSKLISISDSISIDGGMSCNPYFCQFLSDVLQKQIVVPSSAEQTSLGTAMLVGGNDNVETNSVMHSLCYEPVESRTDSVLLFNKAVARCKGWK